MRSEFDDRVSRCSDSYRCDDSWRDDASYVEVLKGEDNLGRQSQGTLQREPWRSLVQEVVLKIALWAEFHDDHPFPTGFNEVRELNDKRMSPSRTERLDLAGGLLRHPAAEVELLR